MPHIIPKIAAVKVETIKVEAMSLPSELTRGTKQRDRGTISMGNFIFATINPSIILELHKIPKAHQTNPTINPKGSILFWGLVVVLVTSATIQLRASNPTPTLVPNGDQVILATVTNNPAACILLALTKKDVFILTRF